MNIYLDNKAYHQLDKHSQGMIRGFLNARGHKLEDCQSVTVGDRWVTVITFVTDSQGRRFIDPQTNDIATNVHEYLTKDFPLWQQYS